MYACKGLRLCAAAMALLVLAGCGSRANPNPGSSESSGSSMASADPSSGPPQPVPLSVVLKLGEKYLSNLDFENAIIQFNYVLKEDPKNKAALGGKYAAYAAGGETEQADATFNDAEQLLGDDAFLQEVLEAAKLVNVDSGGREIFQSLSDRYLSMLSEKLDGSENSPEEPDGSENSLKRIGEWWLVADPKNPNAYVPLIVFYDLSENEAEIASLIKKAEEKGVASEAVNTSIEKATDGKIIIHIGGGGNGGDGGVSVSVDPSSGIDPSSVNSAVIYETETEKARQIVRGMGIDPDSPEGKIAVKQVMEGMAQ